MRSAVLLALLVFAVQDPAADAELWKKLDGDDPAARKSAFEELRKLADPALQTRLKKSLQTSGSSWLKKAVAERSRALRPVVGASRKGFNPQDFAARQKEMLGLLAAGNTKAMEAPVKKMWKEFYFDSAEADKDEKFSAARDRALEAAAWQKSLGVPEKDLLEKSIHNTLRSVDDTQLFGLLQKRDQKVMADNAALRESIPAGEFQQAWVTNQYRILVGKVPLRLNSKLCDAAREHCKDMVEKDFFDHISPLPGKKTPGDRAARHGASAGGENILMGDSAPEDAFWGWFSSLGHHKNMVGDYSEIGVGNHQKHWTQMFN
jgi:hypothetical protein